MLDALEPRRFFSVSYDPVSAVLTVVGTFISDLVLMWVDPRIRYQLD